MLYLRLCSGEPIFILTSSGFCTHGVVCVILIQLQAKSQFSTHDACMAKSYTQLYAQHVIVILHLRSVTKAVVKKNVLPYIYQCI